jgi:2-hydroxychromene-2-carboxylate isomerase
LKKVGSMKNYYFFYNKVSITSYFAMPRVLSTKKRRNQAVWVNFISTFGSFQAPGTNAKRAGPKSRITVRGE